MAKRSGARAATSAARRARKKQSDGITPVEVTLSTGVKIRLSAINPIIVTDIVSDLNRTKPGPPRIYNEAKRRHEINEEDPDYVDALRNWTAEMASLTNDAMLLEGAEIVHAPKGMVHWDDDRFISRMRVLRRPIDDEDLRKLAWIKYIACKGADDQRLVLSEIGRLAGASEEDVAAAADAFRSGDGRAPDSEDDLDDGD